MIALLAKRDWMVGVVLGALATASGSDDATGMSVRYDGREFGIDRASAYVRRDEPLHRLDVEAGKRGTGEDDGEWFTFTALVKPGALVPSRLKIDGGSTVFDRVDGPNSYPQENDLTFEAGPAHDERVVRSWLWHHAWFESWEGDQSQSISGTLTIDQVDSDGVVHGVLEIEVKGSLPPVSTRGEHAVRKSGSFATDPNR